MFFLRINYTCSSTQFAIDPNSVTATATREKIFVTVVKKKFFSPSKFLYRPRGEKLLQLHKFFSGQKHCDFRA